MSKRQEIGFALNGDEKRPSDIKRNTLKEQSYSVLRRALMAGQFEPGQQLTVRGIGEHLGVGTMPAREAVLRLVTAGALEQLSTGRIRVPHVTRTDYDEIIAIRLRLEPLAAERAAALATPHDLALIASAWRAMPASARVKDVEAAALANWEFRFDIYRAAQAPLLVGLIESVWLRSGPLIAYPLRHATPAVARDTQGLRAKLVDAMTQQDPGAARQATQAIIESAADWYRANFPFQGD
ncbi:MAG: GntR family transcriptional regulator [Chitinophagaceae bacterium]|nr:GntR family transcriptional regulator [Rubrivivax sp.]